MHDGLPHALQPVIHRHGQAKRRMVQLDYVQRLLLLNAPHTPILFYNLQAFKKQGSRPCSTGTRSQGARTAASDFETE